MLSGGGRRLVGGLDLLWIALRCMVGGGLATAAAVEGGRVLRGSFREMGREDRKGIGDGGEKRTITAETIRLEVSGERLRRGRG